jgi:uncharacterized cupin superfamily protein
LIDADIGHGRTSVNTSNRRHANVANVTEVEPRVFTKGERFALTNRALGQATGARAIGCSLYEVPPGKTAFPNHYHGANEESIYILDGTGSLRIGPDTVAVGPGDYATFPTGPAHSHQLLNTGSTNLRYLCFSTRALTEVVGYPDSKKIGAFSYDDAGQPRVRIMVRESSGVDYYDGELP